MGEMVVVVVEVVVVEVVVVEVVLEVVVMVMMMMTRIDINNIPYKRQHMGMQQQVREEKRQRSAALRGCRTGQGAKAVAEAEEQLPENTGVSGSSKSDNCGSNNCSSTFLTPFMTQS
jgi:hypothetical protein